MNRTPFGTKLGMPSDIRPRANLAPSDWNPRADEPKLIETGKHIQRSGVVAFSEFQINALRDALAAHRETTPGEDQPYLEWVRLAARIEVATGIDIPSETLRQFVEGVTKKSGKKRTLGKDRLKAVADFLALPEIDAMRPEELADGAGPSAQAITRLLTLLDAPGEDRVPPPAGLPGRYECILPDQRQDERSWYLRLEIDKPVSSGALPVSLNSAVLAYDSEMMKNSRPIRRRALEKPQTRRRYIGWGLVSPEDTLLMFLKRDRNGSNQYYLLLGLDDSFRAADQVARLALLEHDYPEGPVSTDTSDDDLLSEVRGAQETKLRVFHRVAG